jgi:hypothetical protein
LTVHGFFSPTRLSAPGAPARTAVPYVEVLVELPLFQTSGQVPLMVDTGADFTVINPRASEALVPPDGWRSLRNPIPVGGAGAGVDHFVEPAVIHLRHSDGRAQRIPAVVLIASPDDSNRRMESVFGRDLLALFVMTYDPGRGLLTLD